MMGAEALAGGPSGRTPMASEAFRPEWDRVGLLASCAGHLRRGESLPASLRDGLAASQAAVAELRAGGPWRALAARHQLDALDQDILACTLAPDAEPTLGWVTQCGGLAHGPRNR